MDDKTKEILDGLKRAMQTESDGYQFYKVAAEKTKDEKGKETFLSLAADELDHLEFLKKQYRSYSQSGRPDREVKFARRRKLSENDPIFSASFKSRLKEAHFEMSALSIATSLELSSMNFYKEQAKKASDPEVASFYNELADWETTHYRLLINQQRQLQEDYWLESGFYPF